MTDEQPSTESGDVSVDHESDPPTVSIETGSDDADEPQGVDGEAASRCGLWLDDE